jgi:hypothetical protein
MGFDCPFLLGEARIRCCWVFFFVFCIIPFYNILGNFSQFEFDLFNKFLLFRLIISIAWVVHIVLYLLIDPPLSPFLNEVFIKLDSVWGI